MTDPTIFLAFLAGLLSFLSPCILPLIPGFLAYLSNTSIGENKTKTFLNSLAFVLGFSLIFALLGILLNTALKNTAYAIQIWLSRIAGLIIIIFALHTLNLITISFLNKEHKFNINKRFSITYITSFLFGAAFAVGWTPCVGAILGSIIALAAANPSLSFFLLLSYAIGLGIPFLLVGLFTKEAAAYIKKSSHLFKYFNIVVGILLLLLGVLVFTNNLNIVANWGFIFFM